MSNIMLFGAGRMGQVIAHAMERLGHSVSIADTSSEALNLIEYDSAEYKTYHINDLDEDLKKILSQSFDLVISALPYHATKKVARACIENGTPYCDLGGSVPVSQEINDYADEVGSMVFTDLGLAPGLVNILAEWGYNELGGADDISMMVGGLPNVPSSNLLGYTITWSIDGLINEYKDDCEILEDGEIKIVKGMDGLESVVSQRLGEYEAFYTSGGASHTIRTMKERGVKNCSYKTLRYKGHNDIVKFLIRDCDLTDECLAEIFEKGCNTDDDDIVVVRAVVELGNLFWKKELIVYSDNIQGRSLAGATYSAMQKSTAFSLAAVADLMARNQFENRPLGYKDIPFDSFSKNLSTLGIRT